MSGTGIKSNVDALINNENSGQLAWNTANENSCMSGAAFEGFLNEQANPAEFLTNVEKYFIKRNVKENKKILMIEDP